MSDAPPPGTQSDTSHLPSLGSLKHWAGFVFSGLLAFAIDGLVMEASVRLLGMPTLLARIFGIACAMVAAWLCHRRLTFALTTGPTLRELGRYVAAASTAALLNYGVFAAILLARPPTPRLAALVAATGVATIFSYLSMRYAVFRRS